MVFPTTPIGAAFGQALATGPEQPRRGPEDEPPGPEVSSAA
jgi:hypothetical protein